MKNNLSVICAALFMLCLAGPAAGQVAARYEGGPMVVFTSETDPPGRKGKVLAQIRTTDEKNLFSRVFIDTERKLYFGYDLVVEPAAAAGAGAGGAKQFKLTFKSLSVAAESVAEGEEEPGNSKYTPMSLPKYPEPQVVREGDTLAMDVLVNPQTGVKIVDLIKVVPANSPMPQTLSARGSSGATGGGAAAAPPVRQPKDFTIDAVELKVSSSRLFIDGKSITGDEKNPALGGVTGALIWFYLRDRGRFILSLVPRPGYNFQKAGTVRGNKISFTAGGRQYEWISDSPVVTTTDDVWNLWVLEDRNYKPDIESKDFYYAFGAVDDAAGLLQKN